MIIEATPDDVHVHAVIMEPQNTKDFAVTITPVKNVILKINHIGSDLKIL